MKNNKIRIKDIAEKAGVSKGTVDRVLHNRGNVSVDAKEKILAAMKELNYRPNLLASTLASNKIYRVAALLPHYQQDPFWRQPKDGINRAIQAVQDYGISIDFFFFTDPNREEFKEKGEEILAGNYDAVLIAPIFANEGHQFLDKAHLQQLKFVQINTYLDRAEDEFLCYIGQNSFSSGKLAGKLLNFALQDNDKVMILHLEKAVYNSQHLIDKENGFRAYFNQYTQKNIQVIKRGFEDTHDKERLKQFLYNTFQANPDIKGIFVTTSKVYYIVPILEELGLDNIKLVGFDLIEPNLNYLNEEKITFLINQNPLKQGYMGIVSIFHHFIRKKKLKKIQHLPLDVVMKENVEYYLETEEEKMSLVV